MAKEYFCLDCNKRKSAFGIRCLSCANKKKWSSVQYRENMQRKHKGIIPANIRDLINYNKTPAARLANSKRQTGRVPWNKGLKGAQKDTRSGKLLTIDQRVKLSLAHGGDGLLNKRTERQRAMQRKDYILWRTAVFMRDDYTCQNCDKRGVELNADHIKPWALYPELRYAIDNGRTLCVSCHRQTDTWGNSPMYRKVGA